MYLVGFGRVRRGRTGWRLTWIDFGRSDNQLIGPALPMLLSVVPALWFVPLVIGSALSSLRRGLSAVRPAILPMTWAALAAAIAANFLMYSRRLSHPHPIFWPWFM